MGQGLRRYFGNRCRHVGRLGSHAGRPIFRLETERTISNDWVIRHEGRGMQLPPRQRRYGPTQSKALVCESEQGVIKVYYRGRANRVFRSAGAASGPRPALR
jgi:hypothetical protein